MALVAKIVPDVRLVSPSSEQLLEHGQRCKAADACSECAWLLKGSTWRKRFPWLRAGYAGKRNILTMGCKDCALHAAQHQAAGSDTSQLSAYANFSVQPDTTWKLWRFRHHAKSKYHIAAQTGDSTSHAPGEEIWKIISINLVTHPSPRQKCQKFDEKFTAATSRLYTNVSEKLRRTNVSGQLRRNVANLLRMST